MTIHLLLAFALGSAPADPPPDRWFAEDKVRHFVASFFATSIAVSGARAAGIEPGTSLAVGAAFGVGAGLAKEVHDVRRGGIFSLRDLVWDVGGVGASVALLDRTR